MTEHFASAVDWDDAERFLTFRPRVPRDTAGAELEGLRVHVRDHRARELAPEGRSLEAHYGVFTLAQSSPGAAEARRRVVEVGYGSEPREARIAGREARTYEAGPVPPPDDPDPRMPAVVTWWDGDLHFLLAAENLSVIDLVRIAGSIYRDRGLTAAPPAPPSSPRPGPG